MDRGPLAAWASLHHDTGGPWNVKYVHWVESWDPIDDLLETLGEARQGSGMDVEGSRAIRAHADDAGRSVARSRDRAGWAPLDGSSTASPSSDPRSAPRDAGHARPLRL